MQNLLTRNPNLDLATANVIEKKTIDTQTNLVNLPDWWWTGKPPLAGVCPGVDENGKIYSLPLPNLSKCTRQEILDYFDNTWTLTEVLFSSIKNEETFYISPYHQLRHPLIFYYCHPATLYINKLIVAGIVKTKINDYFEQLFETGVDEMSWDDMSKNEMKWPLVKEVNDYRRKVYKTIRDLINTHPEFDNLPITPDNPVWAVFMGFEHERIHLETSSVLLRELPVTLLARPQEWLQDYSPITDDKPPVSSPILGSDYPTNEMLKVVGDTVSIGKPIEWPSYGWDNEYGHKQARVRPFSASKYLISNGEFYEFVKAGGYTTEHYWLPQGWEWRTFRNAKWPTFWVACGPAGSHQYKLRTCFEVIDMPWSCPVIVNYYEAKAFCAWLSEKEGVKFSYRIITEAEHNLIRDRMGTQEALDVSCDPVMTTRGKFMATTKNINFNLAYGSEIPVNALAPNSKGFNDVFGNLWEWCEDDFHPLPGFEIHKMYDDFSTPCFDGKHKMIIGGSFISTGDEASIWARFHFRPHFFQHTGFRVVCSDDEDSTCDAVILSKQNTTKNVYETNHILNEYMLLHYGSVEENMPFSFGPVEAINFPLRCAQLVSKWATKMEIDTRRALDIGCSVGRATFEMARSFEEVVGIDLSNHFINAAKILKESGSLEYFCKDEGDLGKKLKAVIDKDIDRERVVFRQADACSIPSELLGFDVVLLANVICRLPSPKACLSRMGGTRGLVRPNGLLVITSPYTWMEQFTPKPVWLGGYFDSGLPVYSIDGLRNILGHEFELVNQEDMPLLIREHSRKFQYIVAHATVWQRKDL